MKKKIKINCATLGKDLKIVFKKEFSESDLAKNYIFSKICIYDTDFNNELVDLTDDEIFMVNFKAFIQLSLVKYFF